MTEKDTATSPPPRKRRRRVLWIALLLVLLVAGAVCYPPVFRFGVRAAVQVEAWRHHTRLSIGKINGSLFEPLAFLNVKLSHKTAFGTEMRINIAEARASFSWKNLLLKKGIGWWQELRLDGVNAIVLLPTESKPDKAAASASAQRGESEQGALILPAALDVSDAAISISQDHDSVTLSGVAFRASELHSDEIRIGSIDIQQPWLATRFENARGTIAMQESRITVADLKLQETLTLQNASTDFLDLARGRLRMDFGLAAFGGTIRGELTSGARDEHLNFESAGSFSNISIAQLAAFLGEEADGRIKDGKFTFYGSLRNLPKATFTTWIAADDFRWGGRQWNSLTLGATVVNRRVMIPEFQLRQAHNTLSLRQSEMIIPSNWRDWWQGDFNFNIAAKIDNLSELSALFGADFADIAGKLTVDGSVRGQSKSFNGQLIIAGSQLSWRTAPLDELRAAIKLNGNEIQIANAEFVHGDDFLRGKGVVNILGEKRYSGEVKAAVADLALYSAFMQPPLAPQAFAGGFAVEWSGDGSANAHSGAFKARLKKIRPLGSGGAGWHPLNLDAEGTYSPESIYFNRFVLADTDTWMSAKVTANPRLLTLQELRLEHKKTAWLEGDAQLPLNLWSVWQNPFSAAWWNFESPCKLNLAVQGLSLHEALILSGRDLPIHGELRGNVTSDGTLANLSLGGQLSVKKAAASTPRGELKNAEVDVVFDGHTVQIKSSRVDFNGLTWSADGAVTVIDVRDPKLALAVRTPGISLTLSNELRADFALDLRVNGSPAAPQFSGEARLLSAMLNRSLSIESLLAPGSVGFDAPLQPVAIAPHPEWSLDLNMIGLAPLKLANAAGKVAPELRIAGTAAAPRITGEIEVAGLTVSEGKTVLTIESGSVLLGATSNTPTVALRVKGSSSGTDFSGVIFGAANDKKFDWDSSSGLDAAKIASLIAKGSIARDPGEPLREVVLTLESRDEAAMSSLEHAARLPQPEGFDGIALWQAPAFVLPEPQPEPEPAPAPASPGALAQPEASPQPSQPPAPTQPEQPPPSPQ